MFALVFSCTSKRNTTKFLLVILNEYGIYAVFKLLSSLRNLSNLHGSGRLKFVVSIYAEF